MVAKSIRQSLAVVGEQAGLGRGIPGTVVALSQVMLETDGRLRMLSLQGALYRGAPFFKRFRPFIGVGQEGSVMLVKQLLTSPAPCCRVGDTLAAAARTMWDADSGALVVVDDEGRAVAMLTDGDVCAAAANQGKPLAELSVRGHMSQALYACHPDDVIEHARQIFDDHAVRRLPVLDEEGRPIGMLTAASLARPLDVGAGRATLRQAREGS